MSLNYPLNPDTSFESFFLTKESDVQTTLGISTYSQNDCSPLNYKKIMEACVAGTLTRAPLREIVYISDSLRYDLISLESANNLQSVNEKNALVQAYNYWKLNLLSFSAYQCVGGVVTEIKTELLPDSNPSAGSGLFQIVTKLKINWLVLTAKSAYA